jgi:hypothetical protein
MIKNCTVSLVGYFVDLFLILRSKYCINRGCFSLLLDHNITCSHCERDSLALVLDFFSLGGVAQLFEGVISW